MTDKDLWMNRRFMGERAEKYLPGRFCPVHLGDVIQDRYHIFRKLGTGSQCTVWLARDRGVEARRYVALKVFSAQYSNLDQISVEQILGSRHDDHEESHPGKRHVELALDSFEMNGPNGQTHLVKVLEPLGPNLATVIEEATDRRAELNDSEGWVGKAAEGDGWSIQFAKRACYQVLLGLDYLHARQVAHRDVRPGNVCLGLRMDLAELSENGIQQDVWRAGEPDQDESSGEEGDAGDDAAQKEGPEADSGSDSESEDSRPVSPRISKMMEQAKLCRQITEQQWAEYRADPGDASAEPHTPAWNKANFVRSAEWIELLHRSDRQPPQDGEIRYTVAGAPLADEDDSSHISPGGDPPSKPPPFRVVLVDLGFACPFSDCESRKLVNVLAFAPPEGLLPGKDGNGVPCSHRGDVFSLGLLFWHVVMLRQLAEPTFSLPDDDKRTQTKSQLLRDLAQRIGPFPAELRSSWPDADRFVDGEGNAIDNLAEVHGEEVEPGDFGYGDIWYQGRQRKPLDMSDGELEVFVGLVLSMLRWQAEERPYTAELLEHEWFKDLCEEQ
ncbi:hypothetical protein MCOR02_003407 [Pyricularia oryzae]|uniref:non-specific serine/threonine protein kinase n=2 Tax=Pyricularia TaxID=48558 RepID=A0ABQ8NG05_PYRGI|nr:hypothetical protein MCOR01_009175 [Pyricularia oryzae]KAI6296492.1 hypothetical protein MCOR33_006899 [Pyricularia grisea]KAH9439875.1 hypothetical protein MCOR02_003407 [Pyricularia oryzae]KAI6253233.1 hypothetical protein MCOR19_010197 [Pyricularia oryzae]KAI6273054.1 hypothetical protein MCOR26_007058 [Pyricularia oryzae]